MSRKNQEELISLLVDRNHPFPQNKSEKASEKSLEDEAINTFLEAGDKNKIPFPYKVLFLQKVRGSSHLFDKGSCIPLDPELKYNALQHIAVEEAYEEMISEEGSLNYLESLFPENTSNNMETETHQSNQYKKLESESHEEYHHRLLQISSVQIAVISAFEKEKELDRFRAAKQRIVPLLEEPETQNPSQMIELLYSFENEIKQYRKSNPHLSDRSRVVEKTNELEKIASGLDYKPS